MSLGRKISQLRKLKDLTQGELAERLNIHQSMITRWERDQVQPKSSTLERLAKALDTSVEELFSGSEGVPSKKTSLRSLDNRRLAELLGQIHELDPVDQEALTAVLDAMLTKSRIRSMVGERKTA
jgi:transcriptional regulator with XRE-family HTH domain